MKLALRVVIVPAGIWAILPPGSYGQLFAAVTDWSALPDFIVVASCVVLVIAAYKRMFLPLWIMAYTLVTGVALSGFLHHFRDSGESGPLPFEWINSYYVNAFPLLFIALLTKVHRINHEPNQPP